MEEKRTPIWSRLTKDPLLKVVLIALILHLIGILISMFIYFPYFEEARERFKVHFRLKEANDELESKRIGYLEKKQQAPKNVEQIQGAARTQAGIEDIPVKDMMANVDIASDKRPMIPAQSGASSADELHRVMMQADERLVKEVIENKKRSVESLSARSEKALLQAQQELGQEAYEYIRQSVSQLANAEGANVDTDPQEGMPGFTPSFGDVNFDAPKAVAMENKQDVTKFDSLDDFLEVELKTYQDPVDGKKYYHLKIYSKPGAKLAVMPKEIIFLIDSSLSISRERLTEVKKGIQMVLEHLNPQDTFNVVSFKEKAQSLWASSVPATPQNIKMATDHILSLTSDRKTDVYSAISEVVEAPKMMNPSNIVLISDGKPSQGVQNAREILSKLSRENAKQKPIFCFSGGAKVNRYLLDFIAYQNRAWSEYVKRAYEMDEGLFKFYLKIKDPILIGLDYGVLGLNEKEIYPRDLPDLYKGAQFNLYGQYTHEDQFVMRIMGHVQGKPKELIFKRSLKDASSGTAEIKTGYAFNKIYDLISQLSDTGQDAQKLKELETLSRYYSIETPYSEEIARRDS